MSTVMRSHNDGWQNNRVLLDWAVRNGLIQFPAPAQSKPARDVREYQRAYMRRLRAERVSAGLTAEGNPRQVQATGICVSQKENRREYMRLYMRLRRARTTDH